MAAMPAPNPTFETSASPVLPHNLSGRRVVVMGMARSGVAAAVVARDEGATVICTDRRPDAPRVPGTTAVYGEHRRDDFTSADLVIVSPGVPAAQADVAAAIAAGVPVVGELGFAASRLGGLPLLAVSGTNGKSTATHLLGQILANAGRRTFVGGNFGRPLSEAVALRDGLDVAVVEVSSYQMELPGGFHPLAAVILNLTPDHLERHGSMDNYGAHKCRLFARMGPNDAAVVPAADVRLDALSRYLPGTRLYLGGSPGVRWTPSALELDVGPDPGSIGLLDYRLPGEHNRVNLAAAVLLASWYGLRRAEIDPGQLEGLAHRLEPVREHEGVLYVNDSKATNVDATLVALAAIERPVVVMLGGRAKARSPWSNLLLPLAKARAVVCFGEAGPEIAAALRAGGESVVEAGSLGDGLQKARALARSGDVVLLSPACASFDEFSDFEHRGRVFAGLVRELT